MECTRELKVCHLWLNFITLETFFFSRFTSELSYSYRRPFSSSSSSSRTKLEGRTIPGAEKGLATPLSRGSSYIIAYLTTFCHRSQSGSFAALDMVSLSVTLSLSGKMCNVLRVYLKHTILQCLENLHHHHHQPPPLLPQQRLRV